MVIVSKMFEAGGKNIKKRIGRNQIAGIIVLLLGIAMIMLGYSAGETIQVLHKAVRVCLECIGIG